MPTHHALPAVVGDDALRQLRIAGQVPAPIDPDHGLVELVRVAAQVVPVDQGRGELPVRRSSPLAASLRRRSSLDWPMGRGGAAAAARAGFRVAASFWGGLFIANATSAPDTIAPAAKPPMTWMIHIAFMSVSSFNA